MARTAAARPALAVNARSQRAGRGWHFLCHVYEAMASKTREHDGGWRQSGSHRRSEADQQGGQRYRAVFRNQPGAIHRRQCLKIHMRLRAIVESESPG